jgi:hypothetical protein
MHDVSRRVIRLLSHIRVISSGAASGVTSASSACRCAGRPAKFALRHVTTTDAGWTSVLKLIGERLHSESTCMNQAVRERFRRGNPWIISIIDEMGVRQIGLDTPSRDHPVVLEGQYRCSGFEVGIVVDNGELVCGGKRRGEEVGHADGSVLACCC